MATPLRSYTLKLTPEQAEKLANLLNSGNYIKTAVPYTTIAVKAENFIANLYTSGKVLIQGAGTEEFVKFVLEPQITGEALLDNEEAVNPEAFTPHMGIDESGKGDYFGPLVACSVYTDPTLSKRMMDIGAKDCKALSDKQVLSIGEKLRDLLGPNRFKVVAIGPEAYNRMYSKNSNVNRILSWAHARAIENLLESIPSCPRAVADQFGAEWLIKSALMEKGRSIILEQHHKAESDIAVAAASVIAREQFLLHLAKLSQTCGIQLPKGASQAVIDAAKSYVAKHGPDALGKVAKLHFKTTQSVLQQNLL